MKIFVSDSALDDLEAIIAYYLDEGVPHIGEEFVSEIIRRIETIPDNPEIGRKVPEFNVTRVRELIHGPFRVVYLTEVKSIHVVRIWRSERLLRLENTPGESEI